MMNFIKLPRRLHVAIAVASMLALGASGTSAQDILTLKFATFPGPTAFLNVNVFEPWFKQIEADAGGRLKVEFLSGGSAGKPQDTFDLVRSGVVDIGWSVTSYNPGRFNAAGVSELPLLINGPMQGSKGMAALFEAGLLDGFDGVKVLGVGTADVARLHHTRDIDGLAGFKGAKVRAAGAVLSDMLTRIGATPVGMPIPSVAESLAKNVIDGAAAAWFALAEFRLIDVTKTHVNVALGASATYLVMNQAKYDQLPADVKSAFDKHTVADFAKFWGEHQEAEGNRIRNLIAKAEGHRIIEPNTEEKAIWEANANEAIAAWTAATNNGPAILEAFRKGIE